MGNKRLEWISVSSLILAISAGIVFGTISIGSQSKKADSPKNKTEQTEDKDKNTEKHKKDDLNNDSAYTDGVYEGSARGYSSDVTVKVTIKDGKIADIEVVSQDETPEYFNEAVKVLDDIIDANSTDVDSISGATISSDALKEAVQNALQKAEKKGTSKKGKSKKNKNKKKSSARSRKSRSSGSAIGHSSGPARSLASSSVNIPEGGRLKDGTYQGSASGYRGNISVSVSVRDGKIAGVDILSYNDDDAYFNSALAVINRMIGQTSANVDSVSGATYSSVGIINAVNDALNKAVEGPSQGKNNKRKANSKAANKPLAKNKKTENDKKPGSKSKDKPSTQATRPKEGKLKDGTYTGSARGFKGNIGVSVTIKDGKIASVDITTNEDDQAYFNSALGVINKMIGKQSGTVDSISGATYSSVGIMNAVNDAINKAIDNSSSKIPSLPTPAPSPLPTPSPSPAPSPSPTPSPLPPKEGKLKDGTYTGSARGFKGNIGVSVTIKDGKIASVDITTNEDDQAYFNSALGVINKMIGKQSGTVDSISGATYSSVGIMNAVNDAINKAIDNSSSKIPEIPKPNPSLPPLPQPQPDPGSEEKPGEKPAPSPGSEEKPQSKEEKALEEKMRRGELAEGSFDGEGSGYNTGKGKVKTKVVIKDGKIIDIKRDEDSYPDDGDSFRTTSAKIIKFLKDPVNGKRNIAIMKMHMDMVEQIANATDPVAKARELVGDYGANYIKNNKDNPSFPLRAYASYAVKAYLSPKYKAKEMYDAVSGATLSAGGTALSVDAALAKAENDKKTNSNIDKIEIVENKDGLIEKNFYTKKVELLSNKADLLDLSDLKVKLIYKDKKEEIVSYKDFAKYGLEIKGEDGKAISDKMNFTDEVKNKKVLNATITHKDSKRSVDLAIKFGLYSKDYIKKMEYSLDKGQSWTEIENPTLSDENKKNIAEKQSIKLKKDDLGKEILVRTTTVKGNTYTYKSDDKGVQFDRIKLPCTDNSYEKNNNASFAVFLVISEDKSSPSKPGHEVDPHKPETEASDGDIDLTFALKNLNHRKIDDLTIKAANGVTITSAEGLPEGLRLEGNKILGTIEIADDKFEGAYKVIDVTIHATKDGNNIKKTLKLTVYQDKDRDGIDDNEEGYKGANRFDPTTPGNKTPTIEKVRGEAEPTLDEYKALFNNIPDDGSVKVEITQHPDMNTKDSQATAKLKFTSTHVSGVSYKLIAVKLVDKPKFDPKAQLEKTIDSLTVRSQLLNGEFMGYGVGFDVSRGKLKTIVKIENGDIKQVTFVEGKGYSGDQYRTMSSKAISYLAGDNGKRNVAILRAHESYVNQIMAVDDMDKRKKKAEELLGKEYADRITDLRRPEMISPIVREFIAGNLGGEAKQMLDAVTGATLTSGGLGQSVDNALRMSANDKETGNDIKEINIIQPSDVNGLTGQKILKQDRSKALDLSRLKLELVHKDGKKEVVEYKDFKAKGIEIKDRDTGKTLENNTRLTNEEMNQAIIADVTHKGSMRSTDFAIQFETYSDDYIVAMEYKFDGGNWQELANPAKDANNVSYRQTIKINDANRGKNASFRLKTKSGKTYDYTCTSPIKDYDFKYTFLKGKDVATDNPNANFALYITFEKDGASESKPGVEKPDDESGEGSDYEIPKDAKEVGASDINANIAASYINYKEISPITINAGQGVTIEYVDGLPDGLDFVDGSITGLLYSEDSFGSMKEYPITIYGKKDGKAIKRTLKLTVYQDKDRDGTSAMEEGEDGDVMFNPEFKGETRNDQCLTAFIGGDEPSIEDYKKLFKNIPDDGSVTIEVVKKPDMNAKDKQTIARLKFTSTHVDGVSHKSITVKLKAAKAKPDPKDQLEKTIDSLAIRSKLLNGEFMGYGVGFDLSRGKLKTIVEIDHGDIKNVTFVEGKGYSGDQYRTMSSKAIPYLAGVNGKKNVAILRAHENYVNQIMAVEDMDKRKKKAEELLGENYAKKIKDLRRPELISPIVREFMAGTIGGEGKEMLDAVTGATLTSGGLGQSVDNALRMSAHDKETGNDIKEINIIEPSDVNGITGQRVLKQDRSKALDLSRLKLELVHKDGKKEVVEYKDFKAKGIEIKDRDTGKTLENNTRLTNEEMNQAIIADVTHKGSMRSTDFAIQFETYSDDYIVAMEYKFDGGNWQELANPAKDANNVSYRQTIKINDANRGKNASFRLKTKSGKTYDYTCTSPIKDYDFKYTFLKGKDVATDNPNANFALYITFEKDGASESKPGVEKPDDESGEGSDYEIPKDAKEVGASDINANIAASYINYKEISPITITAGQGVTIEDVEGLPEGLDFADGSISGQLYSEDSFASMKEYPITIYGKKAGKAIKRTLKLTVYQDKDRDGKSAIDEGEDGDAMFTPEWNARKIDKKVGDPAPTVDDYMNLITNLPDDGSVSIRLLKNPDMSKPGNNLIRMEIISSHVKKTTTQTINVVVS